MSIEMAYYECKHCGYVRSEAFHDMSSYSCGGGAWDAGSASEDNASRERALQKEVCPDCGSADFRRIDREDIPSGREPWLREHPLCMGYGSFLRYCVMHLVRTPKLAGVLGALGATAIWSGNFIVARGLGSEVPPVQLAFWRWVVAVLVFLPFGLKTLWGERKILARHVPYLGTTAFLGITLFNTLIYIAGGSTSAMNLSLIAITFPVFILLFSRVFFGEPFPLSRLGGVGLVLLGVLLLLTRGNLSVLLQLTFARGDLWMLLASVIFAVYSLLLRRKPKEISIGSLQLATFLLGLLFLAPAFFWERSAEPWSGWNASILGAILYVGICASFLAFLLWNKAITSIGPARAGIIYYTLPLFSAFLAWFFLGEAVGRVHLCSAPLILGGILLANGKGGVKKPRPQ
ncbi:MAG TPA: DMT family transporter [Synergistaceae bacterium]|nr:DMT family transporter [Synergistaceae bacterium]